MHQPGVEQIDDVSEDLRLRLDRGRVGRRVDIDIHRGAILVPGIDDVQEVEGLDCLGEPAYGFLLSVGYSDELSVACRTILAFRMFAYGLRNRLPLKAGLPPSSGPINISVTNRGSAGSKLYDSRPMIPSNEM